MNNTLGVWVATGGFLLIAGAGVNLNHSHVQMVGQTLTSHNHGHKNVLIINDKRKATTDTSESVLLVSGTSRGVALKNREGVDVNNMNKSIRKSTQITPATLNINNKSAKRFTPHNVNRGEPLNYNRVKIPRNKSITQATVRVGKVHYKKSEGYA